MPVHYRRSQDQLILLGQTYQHKERIKALGGRFDGARKGWVMAGSNEQISAAIAFCKSTGGGEIGAAARLDQVSQKQPTPDPRGQPSASQARPSGLGRQTENAVTVSQLMSKVSQTIADAFPQPIWVVGELQNCQQRPSGFYFSLAEAKTADQFAKTITVNGTMWNSVGDRLRRRYGGRLAQILTDGCQVLLRCWVSLYRDRGAVSLGVEDIDINYSEGALALARLKLLKELQEKGLAAQNKGKTLTQFPLRVGLITAPESRAYGDFHDQLTSSKYPGEVLFAPVTMQGDGTPHQVKHALAALDSRGCNLIVITRGGGSMADLQWFDHHQVAYGIARCQAPVLVAIGHHDDTCIAEEISFAREKTPTAAADFIIRQLHTTADQIGQLTQRLRQSLSQVAEQQRIKLQSQSIALHTAAWARLTKQQHQGAQLAGRLLLAANSQVNGLEKLIDKTQTTLHLAVEQHLNDLYNEQKELLSHLTARDPSPWLKRGWTQLQNDAGVVLASLAQVQPGDSITARLINGTLTLRVEDKKERGQEEQ